MSSFMKEFEHLKINLEDLKRATNNFGSKVIGVGGFGKVYEGEISHYKGRSIVAIKRLSREFGQGDPEFFKEIMILSRYSHKNLITLLGYCDEYGEKILVYEHASNGSLDRHLSSKVLTWAQRLKICLDAAKGLQYLHDHRGTQQRILHRDIKSANILLDDNWNAKLSDMGLSKVGSANQKYSVLFTNLVGTPGYCDPQYMKTYALTKESDIYSFGVVLFEVLCGRLCFKMTNGKLEILVPMWKQNYIHKKLDQIIFKDPKTPMDPTSFETFSDIAFQCLHDSREQRPTTSLLVKKLEIALKCQELHDMKLANVLGKPENYGYFDELLSKGKDVSFNSGKTKREGAKRKDAEGSGGSATIALKEAAPIIHFDGTMSFTLDEIFDDILRASAEKREGAKRKDAEGSGGSAAIALKEAAPIIHFDGTMSFTLDDILRASAEVMGKGIYGTYSKAKLGNGDCVVVNRLRGEFTTNPSEVKGVLNFLGKVWHPNLLAMRAYYFHPEEGEKLLFYDYMPRGSLATFLHAQGPKQPVDWPAIMRIAKGVARGLLFLHNHHDIIHGNLTSYDVFLDSNINPKISDFGLSRLMSIGDRVREPEPFTHETPSTKTDVFSLGVIMLELLTREPPESVGGVEGIYLYKGMTVRIEWSSPVLDPELQRYASVEEMKKMKKMLHLATDCVSVSPQYRPEMHLVLQQLEEISSETSPSSSDDGAARPSLN